MLRTRQLELAPSMPHVLLKARGSRVCGKASTSQARVRARGIEEGRSAGCESRSPARHARNDLAIGMHDEVWRMQRHVVCCAHNGPCRVWGKALLQVDLEVCLHLLQDFGERGFVKQMLAAAW